MANTVYLEKNPGIYDAKTDLAISVVATTANALSASDFLFANP